MIRETDPDSGEVTEIQVTEQDPMWLAEDTAAALEWAEYEATICSGCGHPRSESMAPENEGKYDTEVLKCFACEDRSRTAYAVHEDNREPGHGLYFAVSKVGAREED